MAKNKITEADVLANMQDVLVRTVGEFGKPTTYVTVRMKNGFTVRESTTCVDPRNYNEEIGKQICLDRIKNEVYKLLGYELQSQRIVEPKTETTVRTLTTGTHVLCVDTGGALSLGVVDGVLLQPKAIQTMKPLWIQGVAQVEYDIAHSALTTDDLVKGKVYVTFDDDKNPMFIQKLSSHWFPGHSVMWMLTSKREWQCFNVSRSYTIEGGAYPIFRWQVQ
ncbi:MAG: Gp49 family protein [Rikenellaceae bacterium]